MPFSAYVNRGKYRIWSADQEKSKEYINDKIRYALKLVNLEGFENRSIDSLSGGQRRIAIARHCK